MKIAIDAMGGDFAPEAIVEGTLMASELLPADVQLVLVGNEQVLQPLLHTPTFSTSVVEVIHAPEVIGMAEHPTKALSQKTRSSIAIGFHLLKEGAVDAFCGAGNTGAMMVGAMFSVKPLEGILRPTIASFYPKQSGGQGVILDVGANADCKPEVLEQFAELGSLYAKHVMGIANPRVGLMSIGEEEQKGNLVTQAAHQLLKGNKKITFIGNVEGRDLFTDKADVIVCDGFTGNVILKMAESFYDVFHERGFRDTFLDQFNYEAVGGSPILGVNGNVVIGHGISSPLATQNMIKLAARMVESRVLGKIKQALDNKP
ncbi:MAG: phosphate acyltransferase PlsX [Cytophagales bacterium]|jgi:glycerol-3-phosphate acyltransferase PlsX|nr:phosphate acyltransferase PlsX [Cytophagales bacterium]